MSNAICKLGWNDSARLSVTIKTDVSQDAYNIKPEDILALTIKRSVRDVEPAVQVINTGSSVFHIKPEDTSNLAFGKYLYDVQITTGNGDVYTVIGPCTFELMKEVTTNA